MNWFINAFQQYPELAIFLTLALGSLLGAIKIKSFSLGTVTGVLLMGVIIGQMHITISNDVKTVFFLIFLFAVGYSVGPQFFRGLKKDGLPQMAFSAIVCVLCLLVPWLCAKMMGYNMGQAAGLLAGSQTISAVMGVAGDTIKGLDLDAKTKADFINVIPVCYAVTYLFGTAGSAWFLASVAPLMLGGIDKVRAQCKELEASMGAANEAEEPGMISANPTIIFRAYKISNEWFEDGKTVTALEAYFQSLGTRIFVDRIRRDNHLIDVSASTMIYKNDEVVLSGRWISLLHEKKWIGDEIYDEQLLNFPAAVLPVVIATKEVAGITLHEFATKDYMHGIFIRSIKRAGVEIPVLRDTKLDKYDTLILEGHKKDVDRAVPFIGRADRPTTKSDLLFIGAGITIGGLFGLLTLRVGSVPLSLSTSGGALIAGLVFGYLRSIHPRFGHIPEPALWLMNNLGLNLFIAVVGITAGPGFVGGFKQVGASLFLVGAVATIVPLLIGVLLGRYVFKFHPALNLGCNAGSRTTTAALGAIQDALGSKTPALGYTVTYAVGNTLLIVWGVVIILLMK